MTPDDDFSQPRRNSPVKRTKLACQRLALLVLALSAFANPGCSRASETGFPIRVTFWHGMELGVNNEILEAKIDAFNKSHPGVVVESQIFGAADQLGPKLDAAVAGGTPPDLLWWAPAYFPKYARVGALQSVDEFIESDPTFLKDDVYDSLWELGTYEGRVFATPFSANNLAIYYNKEMFDRAGIERPPETWDEFRDAAARLTRDGVHGFQIPAGTSEWTVWTWQCYLWQAGGEILDIENRSAAFDSRAGVAALEYWRSLLADGSAVFSEADAGYKTADFLAGRVAMVINGPWNYAEIRSQRQVEVGVFPLPGNEQAATNIGGESLFLFQSDPARERAAWEFMKFIMSPDFQVDWAIATGYLPVSKSAATSPEYLAFLDENAFLEVYNRQMNVGRVRPSVPEYAAVSAILGRQIEAALYGKSSSEDALARAAAETDRLLK
jgi:multiple sugar transport system substrate-binding protein